MPWRETKDILSKLRSLRIHQMRQHMSEILLIDLARLAGTRCVNPLLVPMRAPIYSSKPYSSFVG